MLADGVTGEHACPAGGEQPRYDYVVVVGGTAGAVAAARLSEDAGVRVGLLEWGPSDESEPRALLIRRWPEMLESQYGLDYRSVPRPGGTRTSGRPVPASSVAAPRTTR